MLGTPLLGENREMIILAEAWSSSTKLAKDYIVRAILQVNGVPLPQYGDLQPNVPPPGPKASWAEEVEYEENVRAEPLITHTPLEPDEEIYKKLVESYPNRKPSTIRIMLASSRKLGGNYLERVKSTLEEMSTVPGNGRAPSPTKRSRFTPEKRARLNRKNLARKKKKRNSEQ